MNQAQRVIFDLVSTPSVSGQERPAAEVFVEHARKLGLMAEIDLAGNAIAHLGACDAPVHIVLLGHIDTVPGEIPVRIEEGILHGRGSVDAKGPLAAMLVAASRAKLSDGVRVTVAGAVGEETAGSKGARYLVGQYRPSACIIGEPSSWDGVTLGYKGRLVVHASATRDCAHTAGPDASVQDTLHDWWALVLEHVATINRGRLRVFDQIQANIRSWESHDDGLQQTAFMDTGFRLPIGTDPQKLARTLDALAGDAIRLEFEGMEIAVASDRSDPVARALTSAIRSTGGKPRPKLKTGTADFNVVAPIWRCAIAAYGPGDSSLDHAPNEHLHLDEYQRSIDVLELALETLAQELAESAAFAQEPEESRA